jgi:hypothetical protein
LHELSLESAKTLRYQLKIVGPFPYPLRVHLLVASEVLWGPQYLPHHGDHFALTEGVKGGW